MAYQTTILSFAQLQIHMQHKEISFEAQNQINKQWNNHKFPDSTTKETWEVPKHVYA
jgi:hypothetical protein